jgi:hypothetical protein
MWLYEVLRPRYTTVMQTFLPHPCFVNSARALDNKRLGKQRVEAFQILRALTGESKGWTQHPATKMWTGYTDALRAYMNCCIYEWLARGFKNSIEIRPVCSYELPNWFGLKRLHASHRSNLLQKDFPYYSAHGWTDPLNLMYVWPDSDRLLLPHTP